MNIFFWLTGAIITNIAARVALAIGLSVVSYVGFDYLLATVFNNLKTVMLGVPGIALQFLGLAGIDTALNYIFSAWSARIAIAALTRWKFS